ncbi:PAS domain-containing sensor histidine kinase, partial [Patescibacteria group bacterium]|nr:PAS domain-containing sensor histidine kinase [Patescibacteria group bacterium]
HSLNQILEDSLQLVSAEIDKREIKLLKEEAHPEIIVYADKFQLGQAFVNLLLNAIEALEKGGQLKVKSLNL